MKPCLGLALGVWLAAAASARAAESQPEYAPGAETEVRAEAAAFDEPTALRQLDADVQASQH